MSSRTVSSMHLSRRKPIAAYVAAIFALSAPSLVHAVPFNWQVTNCKDDGTPGTLRWAANNANGATADTIDLTTITDFSSCFSNAVGVTGGTVAEAILVGSTISLATGGVTINGPGPANLSVTSGTTTIFSSPGDLTINNLTVKYGEPSKSTSYAYGGCIYAHNNVTLTNVQMGHCYLTNTGGAKGGAVGTYEGAVTMTDVVINSSTVTTTAGTANRGAFGGAVYAFENVRMIDSKIYGGTGSSFKLGAYMTGGTGSALGGAVHSHESTVYLSNSLISTTNATVSSTTGGTASGGGIWAQGKVTLQDGSEVYKTGAKTQSTASGKNSYGGGVYSAGEVYLYTGIVRDSSTATSSSGGVSRGGGIFSKGLTDARYAYITLNSSGNGGGVYASNGFTSYYSYFWENKASGNGASVDMPVGNALVRGTTVTFGTSSGCCSGLDFHDTSGTNTVSVTQSTITQNSGSSSLYVRALTTKIYNSTIVYNNSAGSITSGPYIEPGAAGATVTIASNLMSSNTFGASATKDDFFVVSGDTVSGDHNLIRNPGTAVPGDTITGKCPLLYPGRFTFFNKQWQFPIRHEVKSPATNVGSNPLNLTADQRGGSITATSPKRSSGEPNTNAAPDIGAYEINEADEIFDNRFEGCN